MQTRRLVRAAAVLGAVIGCLSCGDRETPEQRLERLRSRHEIYPVGTITLHAADGTPQLLIDVQVANQGVDPLRQLTVKVTVTGHGGQQKLDRRVTLDLGDLRPGVGERRTVTIPGIELAEDDEVFVTLEANLPTDVLHSLPEYSEVAAVS